MQFSSVKFREVEEFLGKQYIKSFEGPIIVQEQQIKTELNTS
jgi:hypothetical protein